MLFLIRPENHSSICRTSLDNASRVSLFFPHSQAERIKEESSMDSREEKEKERKSSLKINDLLAQVTDKEQRAEARWCLIVGLLCCMPEPEHRPSMGVVINMLGS
jgi:hypothetical protein